MTITWILFMLIAAEATIIAVQGVRLSHAAQRIDFLEFSIAAARSQLLFHGIAKPSTDDERELLRKIREARS